jgi:hypothetical protein
MPYIEAPYHKTKKINHFGAFRKQAKNIDR